MLRHIYNKVKGHGKDAEAFYFGRENLSEDGMIL